MEWTGLSKSVNAEETKGYHARGREMMTNLQAIAQSRRLLRPESLLWPVSVLEPDHAATACGS
ncbi:hypothetical protein ELQ88_14390 [Pseudomonas sp. MPC6]|nr:hypothetical protein ELQ88_14390 [Pseudomonas sp. MPC6]